MQLSVVTADKAYDSEEDNHVLVRDVLHALSVIPARYEHVPIRKTHGRYRKQMKRGYCKLLYNQRNKNETIVSVIKRLFGEWFLQSLTACNMQDETAVKFLKLIFHPRYWNHQLPHDNYNTPSLLSIRLLIHLEHRPLQYIHSYLQLDGVTIMYK